MRAGEWLSASFFPALPPAAVYVVGDDDHLLYMLLRCDPATALRTTSVAGAVDWASPVFEVRLPRLRFARYCAFVRKGLHYTYIKPLSLREWMAEAREEAPWSPEEPRQGTVAIGDCLYVPRALVFRAHP
jgi:hypothetical protein